MMGFDFGAYDDEPAKPIRVDDEKEEKVQKEKEKGSTRPRDTKPRIPTEVAILIGKVLEETESLLSYKGLQGRPHTVKAQKAVDDLKEALLKY
jgi:hypothetical protein